MQTSQHETTNSPSSLVVTGSIVVVAKCPTPGKSKTRLIPLLGDRGSSQLAEAMLSDVVTTLDRCPQLNHVQKVLLYAPGDKDGLEGMLGILNEIGISTNQWKLLPMVSPDLRSSDLGDILQHALERVTQADWHPKNSGVVILGMDSPVLALVDIVTGLANSHTSALICPADDGGYGMLCVPSFACSRSVFQGVYWSHPLTAVSQMKALTDKSIPVVVGQLMHDIDEPHDVHMLCERLKNTVSEPRSAMVLDKSTRISSTWDLKIVENTEIVLYVHAISQIQVRGATIVKRDDDE
eukprot:scaffold7691_cov97-Cylindrotheca_fusiformis.AAC.2